MLWIGHISQPLAELGGQILKVVFKSALLFPGGLFEHWGLHTCLNSLCVCLPVCAGIIQNSILPMRPRHLRAPTSPVLVLRATTRWHPHQSAIKTHTLQPATIQHPPPWLIRYVFLIYRAGYKRWVDAGIFEPEVLLLLDTGSVQLIFNNANKGGYKQEPAVIIMLNELEWQTRITLSREHTAESQQTTSTQIMNKLHMLEFSHQYPSIVNTEMVKTGKMLEGHTVILMRSAHSVATMSDPMSRQGFCNDDSCCLYRPVLVPARWVTVPWHLEPPLPEVTTLTPQAPTLSRAAVTGWPLTSWCGSKIPSWTWWDRQGSSGVSR